MNDLTWWVCTNLKDIDGVSKKCNGVEPEAPMDMTGMDMGSDEGMIGHEHAGHEHEGHEHEGHENHHGDRKSKHLKVIKTRKIQY